MPVAITNSCAIWQAIKLKPNDNNNKIDKKLGSFFCDKLCALEIKNDFQFFKIIVCDDDIDRRKTCTTEK